jgi:V8-like Glu-specific endopeptidase
MKLALAAFLVILAGCAGNPVAKVNQSTVLLTMDGGTCSGTIVGPHTVLTAEHCLAMEHSLAVDGHPVQV